MAKASEWMERVDAWRASGLSAAEFCEGREYSAKGLLWWSSHFRRHGKPARSGSTGVALARVVRSPVEKATPQSASAAIVVRTKRARVEVRSGADQATLSAVFTALGMTSGGER